MDSSMQAALSSAMADEIQSSDIYVDEEGEWYNKGTKIFREEILEIFLTNLHLGPDGAYFIEWKQSRCALKAADAPLVIARVDRVKSEGYGEEILLRFRHLSSTVESLDPATLYVGQDNVLYCLVRGEKLPARFSRPAYYEFAQWIEENSQTGEFYVELGGRKYPIR